MRCGRRSVTGPKRGSYSPVDELHGSRPSKTRCARIRFAVCPLRGWPKSRGKLVGGWSPAMRPLVRGSHMRFSELFHQGLHWIPMCSNRISTDHISGPFDRIHSSVWCQCFRYLENSRGHSLAVFPRARTLKYSPDYPPSLDPVPESCKADRNRLRANLITVG